MDRLGVFYVEYDERLQTCSFYWHGNCSEGQRVRLTNETKRGGVIHLRTIWYCPTHREAARRKYGFTGPDEQEKHGSVQP